MKRSLFCIVLAAGCGCTVGVMAQTLPADANVIDVRASGAKGDGITDDTEALRAAVKAGVDRQGRYATPPFVYLPAGTYLVTGPIEGKADAHGWSGGWRAGSILWGASREKTVIRLRDRTPDYGDPALPRPVLTTGSESDKTTKAGDPPLPGGGNRAFRNGVYNLTVDVGSGNPGAVGIDFLCSNRGAVENVTIRSSDPAGLGFCGLRMERNWPGPGLVKRLAISGFDHAIRTAHAQYSMTFEDVRIEGQRVAGVLNTYSQALFFRRFESRNAVPAILADSDRAMTVLLDASFTGGRAQDSAIVGKTMLYARNLIIEGYGNCVERPGSEPTKAGTFVELVRPRVVTIGDGARVPASLPVEETPLYWDNDPEQWANPADYRTDPKGPVDAAAIQAAIDSGKAVVYLPNGSYNIDRTLVVRGAVRLILGLQSSLSTVPGAYVEPLVRVDDGIGSVNLEHLWFAGSVVHNSRRAVAFRHVDLPRGYRNTPNGTGPVFFEDVIGKPLVVAYPQRLFGRQVNCEFGDQPLIENHGGDMWLLGYKTEGQMTVLRTVGGRVELVGGLFYPLSDVSPSMPLFVNDGGTVRLTYVMNGKDYPLHVAYRRSGAEQWSTVLSKAIGGRGPALLTVDEPKGP